MKVYAITIFVAVVSASVSIWISCSPPHTTPDVPGQLLWDRTYGDTAEDKGSAVISTYDDGFMIAGHTASFGTGGFDVYVVKTNSAGNELWQQTYGFVGDEYGYGIERVADGYVIVGSTNSWVMYDEDVYLLKIDDDGNVLWWKIIGAEGTDVGYTVRQTTDGGYIIVGKTTSFGNAEDVYLIKTDSNGDVMWTRNFGTDEDDHGYDVRQTTDGGYIITGKADYDVYLVKTDASGNEIWSARYGGSWSDDGQAVRQTDDGGYIIAGKDAYLYYFLVYQRIYVIKTNSTGVVQWSMTYGDYTDKAYDLMIASDGDYIVTGRYNENVFMMKVDQDDGDVHWFGQCGGGGEERGLSMTESSDGCYVVAGYTYSYGAGDADVYLIKVAP